MAMVKCPKCFHVNPDGQSACVRCNAPLPRIRIEAQLGSPPQNANLGESPESQFRRGQVVAARYSVQNLIGRGGMGAIYKVHDNVLGETVALKTLLPQFVRDKMVVERFFNEAKIARRLAHPNIVRVHDIGNAEGSVYISMEYVQGISLRAMLEGMPAGQRLSLGKVLAIIDALCAALEYAHQYTIHRDIKPENIMVSAEGVVKLMDFGISKLMADTRMTAASVVMGTPFYMSPEQLKNSRDVDARADIYSVGVVLYEALTGNIPTGVPKPASQVATEVPPAIDNIILRCVATDPRERYMNVSELRAALKPILDLVHSGGDLSSLVRREKAAPGAAFPWGKAAGWVLLLGLALGAIAGLYQVEKQRKASAEAAAQASAEATPDTAVPATVSGGAIGWEEFSALVEQLDAVANTKSGESPALYRRARELWLGVRESHGTLTDAQKQNARQALQYYVAILLKTEVADMVFINGGRVTVNGKPELVDPFYIDRHEVTNTAWQWFCGRSQADCPACKTPPPADDLPVTGVSFFDAQAFAAAANKLLPTDAQWTAAALDTLETETVYPWGDEPKDNAANVEKQADDALPAPVESFKLDLTKSGLSDMAGNVAEWTRTPASGGTPDFGVPMVVRGGSFNSALTPLSEATSAE